MNLVLKNILLRLKSFHLEVDLEIHGRITALFGPSGSGKTSLLNLIAGLRRPQSAIIQLGGKVLTDTTQRIFVPPHQRGIGYVPQDLALFPHMSVRQNLLYGHKEGIESKKSCSLERVLEVLEIESLVTRGIKDLSRGEKQRIALARALLSSPRLLLLDEPLANLDLKLKTRILPYLSRIRDEFQIPMLYVTHDRFETLSLADEMMVLVEGKVAQTGPVQKVFGRPVNLAVAGLFTVETIQPGRIVKIADGLLTVAVGAIQLTAVAQEPAITNGDVHVCIRAEDVTLLRGGDSLRSARNQLPATIVSMNVEGPLVRVDLNCGFPLVAFLTKQACEELTLKAGDQVVALIKAPNIHLIPR